MGVSTRNMRIPADRQALGGATLLFPDYVAGFGAVLLVLFFL